MNNKRFKIGLLYTGGNISFDPEAIFDNDLAVLAINKWMLQIPEVQIIAKLDPIPPFTVISSSMMTAERWESMGKQIYDHYNKYDGFIITHGQDGMPHSASALSYILQKLSKPIIITGALLPIQNNNSLYSSFSKYAEDKIYKGLTKANVINAVYAACSDIAEVAILYGNTLLRGNRSVLTGYFGNSIYNTIHVPPLATVDFGLDIAPHCRRRNNDKLIYNPTLEKKVAYLKLHPDMDAVLIDCLTENNYKGLVLEVMGIGSFPPQIIPSVKKAIDSGMTVIASANKQAKWVDLDLFYTGWIGRDAGVIATLDMTSDAAYTKLMWVLSQTNDPKEIKELMLKNVAGEISKELPK